MGGTSRRGIFLAFAVTVAALSGFSAAGGWAHAIAFPAGAAAPSFGVESQSRSTFVHGPLPPPPPGSTAPYNTAAEPQIRTDGIGTSYISSENGVGSGTDAWKSTNGGLTYGSLPQPNAVSSASSTTGLAPGGGDTDLATASALNSNSRYNVYVASLTVGSVTVSASADGGATWSSNVYAATLAGDDREWIAAYGASTFYLSYHNTPTGNQIIVNEGTLVGGVPTSVATYDAINPGQATIAADDFLGNEIGNIAVDPRTGDVYQVFAGCPPSVNPTSCSNLNYLYMAVGVPTGTNAAGLPILSFTDYVVYADPNVTASLANNFPNVAIDAAGNVYAAWSDDQNVFVAHSSDHGQKWSKPQRVNSGPAVTAIYPWMAAVSPGKVDIVYYASSAAQNYQTCATAASTDPCQTEPWYVYLAQNGNVLKGGAWTQLQVTPVVHYGGVCQGGIGCMASGNDNRDLFDDFGVAVDPKNGMAVITYSDDQYSDLVGTSDAGACASSGNNQGACDHTDFATQT